jgi:hypothetical protein
MPSTSNTRKRLLPPIQEFIFYAHYHGTPFSNKLPPIKIHITAPEKICKKRKMARRANSNEQFLQSSETKSKQFSSADDKST